MGNVQHLRLALASLLSAERDARSQAALEEGGVQVARRSAVASMGAAVMGSLGSVVALLATLVSNVRRSVQRGVGAQIASKRARAQKERLATMSLGSVCHVPLVCGGRAARRNADVTRKVRSCAVTRTVDASAKEIGLD